MVQLPFSILPFMFCSKLKETFSIFLNLSSIFSFIDANTLPVKNKKIIIRIMTQTGIKSLSCECDYKQFN